MKKYNISFANYRGQSCHVELQTDGTGTVNLTPSTSPFITSELSDTDPLLPIRTSTAQIGIVTNYDDILPLITLPPMSVRVLFFVGTTVKWQGWLSADTYTQDFTSEQREFTLNAFDDLTALKTFDLLQPDDDATIGGMEFDPDLSLIQLRHYICECFSHVDNGLTYCFEQTYPVSVDTILDYRVSRRNWLEPQDEEGERDYSAVTCYEWMEGFCREFGFSLRQIGTTIYFTRPLGTIPSYTDATTLADIYDGTALTGDNEPDTVECDVTGSDHSISVVAAPAKLDIATSINEIDSGTGSVVPGIDINQFSSYSEQEPLYYSGSIEQHGHWYLRFVNSTKNMKQYNNGVVLDQPDYNALSTLLGSGYLTGGIVVSEDYWGGPNGIDPGSTESPKRNYDFHTRLYIVYPIADPTQGQSYAQPSFSLIGNGTAFFNKGGFNLRVKALTAHNATSAYPPFKYDEDAAHGAGVAFITFRLSVGNKYFKMDDDWAGGTWVDEPTTFQISCSVGSQHELKTPLANKTLEMLFKAEDFAIPIDQNLYGKVRLDIVDARCSYYGGARVTYIEDLELTYCNPINDKFKSDEQLPSEYHYKHRISNAKDNDIDVELAMHSDRDGQASYGILLDDGSPLGLFPGMATRVETELLDIYTNAVGVARTYITASIDDDTDYTPLTMIEVNGENVTPLASVQHDWLTNTNQALLIQNL